MRVMNMDKPLRLWPGVAIAIVQLLVMFGADRVVPIEGLPVGMLGGVVGAVLILVWWLLFSRARWLERVGAVVLIVVMLLATRAIADESIRGAGQGMLAYIMPTPYLALALVVWAAATRYLSNGLRYIALVAATLIVLAPFALIRTSGVSSTVSSFHWRWTPTPEELLLARGENDPKPLPPEPPKEVAAINATPVETAAPVPPPARALESRPETVKPAAPVVPTVATTAEWPGFRGPHRDSVVPHVRINADWSASPPVEIWRRSIGPGWSSFAIQGDFLYTQEQRGDDEIVSCYRVSTGDPVWRHRDPVRFWESNGGAGPRATPTLHNGRVYTAGATGLLNALDARTGAVLWSHNVATEAQVAVPMWGFSASPLVVDDMVITAASGVLAAFDLATGAQRWRNKSRGGSYSSPHLVTIGGIQQILLLGGPGAMSVAPADGALLWEHSWDGGVIVQPAAIDGDDVLVFAMSMTGGTGTRRLHVTQADGKWNVEERWTSNGLKPYFNDFVVHKGHAYGFDGAILASIDLADGRRKWKGGRYGNGQMLLLADQDLLLVTSEDGELVLVSATPDQFKEVARFRALDAKTWNHPVLVRDVLLVRNGEEMAAFRLTLSSVPSATSTDRPER